MVLVKLLGGISIEGGGVALSGKAAHRHRLALLALLAVPTRGAWSRDKLIAYLWPEKDAARARNLLNQSVHALRSHLGDDAILSSGDELALNPERIGSDVSRFEDAIAAGDLGGAVTHYGGAFLDGFFLPNAAAFEHWADSTREYLRRAFLLALEKRAEHAAGANELEDAAALWQRRTGEEPGNARVTLRLMAALEAIGDHAGALRAARSHVEHLRSEFQAEPSPEVLALAERIRTRPVPTAGARGSLGESQQVEIRRAERTPEAPLGASRHDSPRTGVKPGARVQWTAAAATVAVVAVVGVLLGSARARENGVLTPDAPPFARQTVDPVADRAYRRGLSDHARAVSGQFVTPSEGLELHRSAAREFENAIALAPHWAAAHAQLGTSYQWLASTVSDASAAELYRKAKAAAQRAIEIDPRQAQAQATLGFVLFRYEWDWKSADRAFARAAALDPEAYNWGYAQFLGAAGRHDEAIARTRRARERLPGSDALQWQVAQAYACAGRLEEARAEAAELERRMGGRQQARSRGREVGAGIIPFIAQTLSREGRHAEAIELMEEHVASTDSATHALIGLAYANALAGRTDEARTLWRGIVRAAGSPEGMRMPVHLLAALGHTSEALDEVERAFGERPWTFALMRCSERYWLLRNEPRMQAIVRKIGFPH